MPDHEPVDASAYAANLERLDRIGRAALAADPAEAIGLVREANDLVADLLPMHRQLMAELAHHRATLQAACDELAGDGGDGGDGGAATDPASGAATGGDAGSDQLDRLEGIGDDGAPF